MLYHYYVALLLLHFIIIALLKIMELPLKMANNVAENCQNLHGKHNPLC